LFTLPALVIFMGAYYQGCQSQPHPTITIQPSVDAINAPPQVSAHIVPLPQHPITEVILEFGRAPDPSRMLYTDTSYQLPHRIFATLPTDQPFDATYTFNLSSNVGTPMQVGERIEYQFHVKQKMDNGSDQSWWSDRKTLIVAPAVAGQGPPPGGGGGGGQCAVSVADVTLPATTIQHGTTTDLGGNAPVISSDGRFVAFVSHTKFEANAADGDQIYRRDVQTGDIKWVSGPANAVNGGSVTDQGGKEPSISGDGNLVAFVTHTAFDPNATANIDEVYVRNLQTGAILTVSTPARSTSGGAVTDQGGSSAVISGNGRFVAFVSHTKFEANAADVDQVYRRDLQTGEIKWVSGPATAINGGSVTDHGGKAPSISSDGRFVAFVSQTAFDPNAAANVDQVYVRDLQTGSILKVTTPAQPISGGSVTDLGGNSPVISGDGNFVAFVSRTKFEARAADVDQIYRRELQAGAIKWVSGPANAINGGSVTDQGGKGPTISSDGRFVAFVTRTAFDPNAASNVDQLYVRDLQAGTVLKISTPATSITGGSTTELGGSSPVISADGRFAVFVTRTKFDANAADVDQIYRRCLDHP
jgi:Tol biopolymer transport system component